jgi:hypothetical protein
MLEKLSDRGAQNQREIMPPIDDGSFIVEKA